MVNRFRWVIVLISFLFIFILVLGFVWLLTSVQIANTPFALKTRYEYYFNIAPKLGFNLATLPFSVIAMQEIKTSEGLVYAYIVLGKYEKMDFNNQTLYLSTKNGNIYGFKYSLSKEIPILYRDVKAGGNQTGKIGVSPFSKGEILSIHWGDKRTLDKVLSEAETNPYHLININMKQDEYQLINKVIK